MPKSEVANFIHLSGERSARRGRSKTLAAPALAGSRDWSGDVERNGAMAWIWNRILPKAMRAETTPSARIDAYIAGKIQPDGPGLALAVFGGGALAGRAAER